MTSHKKTSALKSSTEAPRPSSITPAPPAIDRPSGENAKARIGAEPPRNRRISFQPPVSHNLISPKTGQTPLHSRSSGVGPEATASHLPSGEKANAHDGELLLLSV